VKRYTDPRAWVDLRGMNYEAAIERDPRQKTQREREVFGRGEGGGRVGKTRASLIRRIKDDSAKEIRARKETEWKGAEDCKGEAHNFNVRGRE